MKTVRHMQQMEKLVSSQFTWIFKHMNKNVVITKKIKAVCITLIAVCRSELVISLIILWRRTSSPKAAIRGLSTVLLVNVCLGTIGFGGEMGVTLQQKT